MEDIKNTVKKILELSDKNVLKQNPIIKKCVECIMSQKDITTYNSISDKIHLIRIEVWFLLNEFLVHFIQTIYNPSLYSNFLETITTELFGKTREHYSSILVQYVTPITYNLLFYCFDFLDEAKRLQTLSDLDNSTKTRLINAYLEQDKIRFQRISENVLSYNPGLAIVPLLLQSKDFIKRLKCQVTIKINSSERISYIMCSIFPNLPINPLDLDKQIQEIPKEIINEINTTTAMCLKTLQSINDLLDKQDKIYKELEKLGKGSSSWLESLPDKDTTKSFNSYKTSEESDSHSPIKYEDTIFDDEDNKNNSTWYKDEFNFIPNYLKTEQDGNKKTALIFCDIHAFILSELNNSNLSNYGRKKAYEYYNKAKFIFNEIDLVNIKDYSYTEGKILMFQFVWDCILETIKKYISEKEENKEIRIITQDDINTKTNCTVNNNIKKVQLGRSKSLSEIIAVGCKSSSIDKLYHTTLKHLWHYLIGISNMKDTVFNKQSPNRTKYIDCTEEDFMYVLGDSQTTKEKTSENPVINWNEGEQNSMRGFFYALYGELDKPISEDKNLSIGSSNKKYCYLYKGKEIKLSTNKNAADEAKKQWTKIIKICVAKAKKELGLAS